LLHIFDKNLSLLLVHSYLPRIIVKKSNPLNSIFPTTITSLLTFHVLEAEGQQSHIVTIFANFELQMHQILEQLSLLFALENIDLLGVEQLAGGRPSFII
jgi:hypothetical protein